jgi:subtilisin-like proprotein convertase family protein
MKKVEDAKTNTGLWLGFIGVGLIAILVIIPSQFRSQAEGQGKNKHITRTESADEGIVKMYDIREEKDRYEDLQKFRNGLNKNAADIADIRQKFVTAEEALKQQLPTVKVEYNTDIRIPEVITPDVYQKTIDFLTPPSGAKRTDILRGFINQNNELIGLSNKQINDLKVAADYTNPDGNLSYVHFDQLINGIPVFRGEVKAGFTKTNQIIRIINNLAPGLEYSRLSTDFRDPLDAVKIASAHIKHELTASDVSRNDATSSDLKVVFGEGDWATTAEKLYFPTEPGVAVPAWKVLIWQPINAYYVIVDAETGVVLWHKNITEDQTQSATYEVYANSNSYNDMAESPAPSTPGPIDPTLGTQGTVIPRVSRTLIGNEGTLSFNNNGWITDGINLTDGNAVEAGLDIDGANGVDPTSISVGFPNRTFLSTNAAITTAWAPPAGVTGVGDAPTVPQARRGAVNHMFYVMNRYHDELYKRGFVEAANNFQASNFGRGGVENDRVSAEGQDSAGTNNANFSITSDGTRGRMQMFVWSGPTPDKDGTADTDIIIHEVTHGTSGRLHGNGTGLGNQGGMMGEGWGDWYASTMTAEPTDPINGIYSLGGYATHLLGGTFTGNYYYAIRRFPTAVIAFTGGPNNRPHNPLTFGHINATCDTTLGTTAAAVASAFPRNPAIATAGNCSQVHNAGEIWKSALWEVRALMVTRLGFTPGTTKILQLVTDGMKMSPVSPMMLQERDAIIAAAAGSAVSPETSADVADVREGFRRRGFGFSASTQSATAVTEAFDLPNARFIDPFSVSDSTGDNDGFPEPGENVLLSIPVTNPNTGGAITAVVANVNGGANVAYGTIADGATVVRQIPFTVPMATACGADQSVTINVSSSIGVQIPVVKTFRVGVPVGGAPATFSNTAAITINDNAPATPYPSNITVSGLTGNKVIKVKLNQMNHTFPGDIDMLLVGPGGQKMEVMSDQGGTNDLVGVNLTLSDTAAASLPATIVTGEFKPTADATADTFAAPAPAAPYQLPGPGGAATLNSVYGSDGAAMNGVWSLFIVDDAGTDIGTVGGGWSLTFESNNFLCSIAPASKRSDFDGDGRTDLSVFRPSDGNWYLNRSTAGFGVINFGVATDVIAPGDVDGDGKTDEVVFRASAATGTPDFFTLRSSTNTVSGVEWGTTSDVPVIADYDGDNKDDFAVWRPSTGDFWLLQSTAGARHYHFGVSTDKPVPADYNGDNRTDFAVFRPSNGTWYIADNVTNAVTTTAWGISTDIPVFADYDGDGKDDMAVFRPSNGTWYIINSGGGTSVIVFGASGDVPVPGDYDGDGKYDQAVYRAGTWFVNKSTSGVTIQPFGVATDRATPRAYLP